MQQHYLLFLSCLLLIARTDAFHVAWNMASTTPRQQGRLFDSTESDVDKAVPPPRGSGGDVPSMEWLTDALSTPQSGDESDDENDLTKNRYIEEHSADSILGADSPIPTTGVSVSDEMDTAHKDRFYTVVVPIKGLDKGVRAAQVVTTASAGSFEPVRYIVGLSKQNEEEEQEGADNEKITTDTFVMVDVPPFSEQLKKDIQNYMGPSGRLSAILVTSRDCIHYEDPPGTYTIRKADLLKWAKAFPDTARVAYRLDIPRDCRESITQRLDGYGPFALEEESATNVTFIESGRPLTYELWDDDTSKEIMAGKETPPDDLEGEEDDAEEDMYSPEAIKAREVGKRVLAVYTPGRSFGSISYVFPDIQLCASGFTLPIEDTRSEENWGMDGTGPALDCRGYITTSRAGIERQMESSRDLINSYADRFNVILPSRGDPFFMDGDVEERKDYLLDIIGQYEKVGQIYERLGITNADGNVDVF